jgi:hypothetical protein
MRCFTDDILKSREHVRAKIKKTAVSLLFAFCSLLFALPLAWACPFCKDALTQGMAKGFFWSILLMLAVPVAVVSVIAGVIWRAEQKKRAGPDVPHA